MDLFIIIIVLIFLFAAMFAGYSLGRSKYKEYAEDKWIEACNEQKDKCVREIQSDNNVDKITRGWAITKIKITKIPHFRP